MDMLYVVDSRIPLRASEMKVSNGRWRDKNKVKRSYEERYTKLRRERVDIDTRGVLMGG
jgi:hypothetical protein